MKGFILIRNISICFLILVFVGCNTMGTGMTSTAHSQSAKTKLIPIQDKDGLINFNDNGKLASVSSLVIGHASKPNNKKKITWTISPKRTDGRENKVIICIKNKNPDPFRDSDWTNHCSESKNGKLKGIVLDVSDMTSDSLQFNYKVINYNDRSDVIDPPGVIYK